MNFISTIIKYPTPAPKAPVVAGPTSTNGRVYSTGQKRTKPADVIARCGWHPPMSIGELKRRNLQWYRDQRRLNGRCGTCGREKAPGSGCTVCTDRTRKYHAETGRKRPAPSARARAKLQAAQGQAAQP